MQIAGQPLENTHCWRYIMEKPIVLVIMDGVGKGDGGSGDAVAVAKTPTLDHLLATCPHTYLKAHGTAVGLPSDEDMGNSEVGHNALGCGQVSSNTVSYRFAMMA